jgi:DtxR family transcriptional regulator, manganese transport regulator
VRGVPAGGIIAPVPEQFLAAKRTSHDSSARFRRTRAAHRDETAEDYVEAIHQICSQKGEARVRDLAQYMGVSHVTVTRIITRLAKAGLVETEPYRPIELTAAGRRLAVRIGERHETVLAFLRSLGVPVKQAEIDAEGIEHHVSDATIRAMRHAMQKASEGQAGGPESKGQ